MPRSFSSLRNGIVLTVLAMGIVASSAFALPFTVPESKLLDAEFASAAWGGAVARSDAPGAAVRFTFLDLDSAGTGLKDDYPLDGVYGQILPSHASGDFSNFDGFALWVTNTDADPLFMSLFINTGFTGPSGVPSNTPANDTFWQSPWQELAPSERMLLYLDFDDAIPYHVEDNPLPHTQGGLDGVAMAINPYDRSELDAIGFQAYANNNPEASVLIERYIVIPEPSTFLLLIIGLGVMSYSKRRNRDCPSGC